LQFSPHARGVERGAAMVAIGGARSAGRFWLICSAPSRPAPPPGSNYARVTEHTPTSRRDVTREFALVDGSCAHPRSRT